MIKRNKALLGIAGTVLSLSLIIAGCSGGKPGTAITPEDFETAQEKPIEITIASDFDPPDDDGNFVQTYLEKKFKVKIHNVRYDRTVWRGKFNVDLVSGTVPDIFIGDATESDMIQWADQGLIASISVDEIRTYMPKYIEDVESVAADAWAVGTYQGKNWGVPKVWGDGATGFAPAYNGERLKAIGYDEPPQTLEELEDVLTKFANGDPDGNGVKDTFGLTGRGKDYTPQMFNSIFAAFGVAPYQFKQDADGKLVYGGITEQSRETLKLLNKWYKAGIIDPEFITADNGKIQQYFVNGRIGMIDTGLWHHLHETGYFGKAAKDSGVSMVIGKPVIGPAGDRYAMAQGALQAPLMFGKQLETNEKKRTLILQMLEFIATNPEGYLTTRFGEQGVHYDLQGELAVPKPEYIDGGARGAEIGAGGFYNPFGGKVKSMLKHEVSKEKLKFMEEVTSGVRTITDALGLSVLPSRSKYGAILKTLQDQYFVKAITGEADADYDFEQFVEQWLKSGGKEVTEEANKLYRERNNP
ncbi:extracellular solute-binding protein [Paenibacillus tarimensis]